MSLRVDGMDVIRVRKDECSFLFCGSQREDDLLESPLGKVRSNPRRSNALELCQFTRDNVPTLSAGVWEELMNDPIAQRFFGDVSKPN
jgi:hypothetical protein